MEDILNHQEEGFHKLDDTVRSATGTMTSIPKPFKFLTAHYKTLEDFYNDHEFNFKVGEFFQKKN